MKRLYHPDKATRAKNHDEWRAERAADVASQLAGGVLVIIGSIAGAVASFFMFALFLFYLSADGPRLRRWIA